MRERRRKIVLLISSLVIIALIGGTFAAFRASTEVNQKVDIPELGIEIVGDDGAVAAGKDKTGVFGDNMDLNLGVRSDDDSVELYTRVTAYRYWYDGEEKVFNRNGVVLEASTIELLRGNDDWIEVPGADDEVVYLYYKKPLPTGTRTTNFIDSFTVNFGTANTNAYSGLSAKVNFTADGVQSVGAKEAMLAEWGVIADIAADGTLVSVTEQ